MQRLARKHAYARTIVPKPVVNEVEGAGIGILSYGSNDSAIQEARDMLAAQGVKTSYLRLRALPTTTELSAFVARYPRLYVVENNFDGQMRSILQTEEPEAAARMVSLAHCDGLPLTGRWIATNLLQHEQSR